MSKYAYNLYETFIYGTSDEISSYYNAGLKATVVDYNSIHITWGSVKSDPLDELPTQWALVKSFTGTPDTPYGGKIVASDYFTNYLTNWDDIYVYNVDIEVTYSFWVFNSTNGWIFCGESSALIVNKTDAVDKISKWIPRAWQNDIYGIGDTVGEYNTQDLISVIHGYAVEYDKFRLQTTLLEKSNTTKYITNALSKVKAQDFGFSAEDALGAPYHKTLALIGDKINSNKGTIAGITQYITGLTHLQNRVEIGHNLMLDYNDSSFEESLGSWQAAIGTVGMGTTNILTRTTYALEAITAPDPHVYDDEFLPRSIGLAKIVTTATTPVTFTTAYGNIANGKVNINGLIPVKQYTRYTFTGWTRRIGTPSATVKATIYWYANDGTFISSTVAGTAITTTLLWQEFISLSDGYRDGKMSPKNAAFAIVGVTVTPASASSTTTYLDMLQFCEWKHNLEYEDPRLIKIFLRGEQENLLPNPALTDSTGGWYADNCDISTTPLIGITTEPVLQIDMLTNSVDTLVGQYEYYAGPIVWSEWIPVEPGLSYTFSATNASGYTDIAKLGIEFSSLNTDAEQSNITQYGDAYYYNDSHFQVFDASSPVSVYAGAEGYIWIIYEGQNLGYEQNSDVLLNFPNDPSFSGTGLITGITETLFTINEVADVPGTRLLISGYPVGQFSGLTEYSHPISSYEDTITFTTKKYGNLTESPWKAKQAYDSWSVTAVAPPYSKDAGRPYARVFIKPDGVAGNTHYFDNLCFKPALLVDRYSVAAGGVGSQNVLNGAVGAADLVTVNPEFSTSFFTGNGSLPTIWGTNNAAEAEYYLETDCFWEKTIRYNFVSNFDFSTNITGWTAVSPSTISRDTIYDNSGCLKITGSGGASTTVWLPYPATGGESVVVSAYVHGVATYTLQSAQSIEFYSKPTPNTSTSWVRIWATLQMAPGTTSFDLQIINDLSLGVDTDSYVKNVQAEWGESPTQIINPTDPGAFTLKNPQLTSNNLYAAYNQSVDGGRSSYIAKFGIKRNRLLATLDNYTPLGSSWALKYGWPTPAVEDLIDSLVPSASFENDLGSWVTTNATLQRIIYQGYGYDTLTHGIAYGRVTTRQITDSVEPTFGISTDKIYVNATKGYYGSVAIRPTYGTAAEGNYSLRVDGYDINDNLLVTYDNMIAPNSTPNYSFTHSDTPPSAPVAGDRWLDSGGITGGPTVEYTWVVDGDSEQWAEMDDTNVSFISGATNPSYYTFNATPPTTPFEGDIWIDTTNQIGYTYIEDNGNFVWAELVVVLTSADVYLDYSRTPQWAFLNVVIPKNKMSVANDQNVLVPIEYVKIRIECTPDIFIAGQAFDVDRVVFRE